MSYHPPSLSSNDFEAWADCWELVALLGKPVGVSVHDMPESALRDLRSAPPRSKKPVRGNFAQTSARNPGEENIDILWSDFHGRVERVICARSEACGMNGKLYPFNLQNAENFKIVHKGCSGVDVGLIATDIASAEERSARQAYIFMLLATRIDMGKSRSAKLAPAGWIISHKPSDKTKISSEQWLDGAELFERLCCRAVRGFLGPRCRTHHFGAGPDGAKMKLIDKVGEALRVISEGVVKDREDIGQTHGDGGLDLIAWLEFAENHLPQREPRPGRLILFGQCKTGTSYDLGSARRLDPTGIVEDFLREAFCTSSNNIARLFMVSDRLDIKSAKKFNRAGGLLFDRCRITDCISTAPQNEILDSQMVSWSTAAKKSPWFTQLLSSSMN